MNKIYFFILLCIGIIMQTASQEQYIARQGQVSFFSYTSVENIEAKNNQVLSILDIEKREIVVSMLMRAFTFKKDLMYQHFNESYIESDIYPKATFQGKIQNFELVDSQTKIIKGIVTVHGISKEIEIKSRITKTKNGYSIKGDFNLVVNDFNIRIPLILSNNIAKVVALKINFQYIPYEESNN